MVAYKPILESIDGRIGRITLNRLEVHNALNIEMIRELSALVRKFNEDQSIRVIIFDAKGKNFSAGADLQWMKKGMEQSEEELLSESKELATLFNDIYNSPKVTIVHAKGRVIGGANGIVAASDISIAGRDTLFTFSEVKLGLVPATISPYVFKRVGNIAKEWMITARNIDAEEACKRGLINILYDESVIEEKIQLLAEQIINNGPSAIAGVKKLFADNKLFENPDELLDSTSQIIASYRVSEEGQEGISAFFEKRQASWKNDK